MERGAFFNWGGLPQFGALRLFAYYRHNKTGVDLAEERMEQLFKWITEEESLEKTDFTEFMTRKFQSVELQSVQNAIASKMSEVYPLPFPFPSLSLPSLPNINKKIYTKKARNEFFPPQTVTIPRSK